MSNYTYIDIVPLSIYSDMIRLIYIELYEHGKTTRTT